MVESQTYEQCNSPMTPKEIRAALSHEIGTLNYWKIFPSDNAPVITDGVKRMAEMCGAYWLLTEIVSAQIKEKVKKEPFQVWILKLIESDSAVIDCENGNNKKLLSKKIPYTDFPLPEGIRLYLSNGVIMLTSEY